MSKAELQKLYTKRSKLQAEVEAITEKINQAENDLRQRVKFQSKVIGAYSMKYDGRNIKIAPHGTRMGWTIRENGKVIANEVREGISSIRLKFALGQI